MNATACAATYSLHGLQPLAIKPNDKRPLATGWQQAKPEATMEQISRHPGANVGIAIPAGMMVLDVDTKTNGPATLDNFESQHSRLPVTLSATTPSGGRHFWFLLPSGAKVGNSVGIAPGLDIRAAGGYVVAPPSTIDGRAYCWDNWILPGEPPPTIAEAPAWLIDLAQHRRDKPLARNEDPSIIPEGMRNTTLFEAGAAMRNKGFGLDEISDALAKMNARCCSPPLDADEIVRIAASAGSYTRELQPWEIFSCPAPPPPGALPALTTQDHGGHYRLLSCDDLCNAPPMRWFIRGVLPAIGLAAIYGASQSGKSFLVLDMAFAVAMGESWFGHRVIQAPVTYVCLEGESGMGVRIKAWRVRHSAAAPKMLKFVAQPFDLKSPNVGELAAAIIARNGTNGIVIIDTLNRAAPGADENSSVDMGSLIAAATRLQRLVGGLVLLVHHTGKDETKGPRGHSSLFAALDAAIEVTRSDARRTWSVAKAKDGETGIQTPFKLELVTLGSGEDGEIISSCIVVQDGATQKARPKAKVLAKNQRIAYDALRELLHQSKIFAKEGAPDGKPCISCRDALTCVSDKMPPDPKHKKSRAQEAIEGLVNSGIVGIYGEWLWDNEVPTR